MNAELCDSCKDLFNNKKTSLRLYHSHILSRYTVHTHKSRDTEKFNCIVHNIKIYNQIEVELWFNNTRILDSDHLMTLVTIEENNELKHNEDGFIYIRRYEIINSIESIIKKIEYTKLLG